jgi:hypothetical protein
VVGVRSDGDARLDGCGLQVVQTGARFEVQVQVLQIAGQAGRAGRFGGSVVTV